MSEFGLIIVLIIVALLMIIEKIDIKLHRDYDCFEKGLYKCMKCKKRCKWHYVATDAKELIYNLEGIDENN